MRKPAKKIVQKIEISDEVIHHELSKAEKISAISGSLLMQLSQAVEDDANSAISVLTSCLVEVIDAPKTDPQIVNLLILDVINLLSNRMRFRLLNEAEDKENAANAN